ncbi:MAG: hypothetical protein E7491_09755 [Ruminococcaceae bacterium]|nr:hypothetical protein [Oscillospiraceae bacterium]
MAKSYYSKKLDRVISARHNIDKWEVDRAEHEALTPVPSGYSGMHDFAQSKSEQIREKDNADIKEQKAESGILGKFALDDILLAALILILLSDENKNTELILVLAFLLITGLE